MVGVGQIGQILTRSEMATKVCLQESGSGGGRSLKYHEIQVDIKFILIFILRNLAVVGVGRIGQILNQSEMATKVCSQESGGGWGRSDGHRNCPGCCNCRPAGISKIKFEENSWIYLFF